MDIRYLSYNHRMPKKAISVTLSQDNLLWLRGQALARGRMSVSEVLDQILEAARPGSGIKVASRSAVGMIQIAPSDPELREADRGIREEFRRSLDSFDMETIGRSRPRRRQKTKRKG